MSLERFRLEPDAREAVEYGRRKGVGEGVMLGIDTGKFPIVACEFKVYGNRFVVWSFGVFEPGEEPDGEGLSGKDDFSPVNSIHELDGGQLVVLGNLVAVVEAELTKRSFKLDFANNFKFSGIAFRG